jgi:hypothetical protein
MTGETRRFFKARFQSRSLVSREHTSARSRPQHHQLRHRISHRLTATTLAQLPGRRQRRPRLVRDAASYDSLISDRWLPKY